MCIFIVCFILHHMPILFIFILRYRMFYKSSFLAATIIVNACLVIGCASSMTESVINDAQLMTESVHR